MRVISIEDEQVQLAVVSWFGFAVFFPAWTRTIHEITRTRANKKLVRLSCNFVDRFRWRAAISRKIGHGAFKEKGIGVKL